MYTDMPAGGMQNENNPPPQGSSNKNMVKWLAVIVAAIIILAAIWFAGGADLLGGKVLGIDTTYQAVFLTNGQVYFGKLASEGRWMVLRDVYYLQVSQQLQPTGETQNQNQQSLQQQQIQLVKLGQELHGPQDEMYIDSDKVLFWENMKDDSKVVSAIKDYKNK